MTTLPAFWRNETPEPPPASADAEDHRDRGRLSRARRNRELNRAIREFSTLISES